MISPDRKWRAEEGASAEALTRLRNAAPVVLPETYYALLAFSNGGEGELAEQPLWFQLYPAEAALKEFESGLEDENFPGFVFFGSSGGGECLAFDARHSAPWPIVSIDMVNIDLEESVWLVAPDFDHFLELVGVEGDD